VSFEKKMQVANEHIPRRFTGDDGNGNATSRLHGSFQVKVGQQQRMSTWKGGKLKAAFSVKFQYTFA
jgi:hypothetical protein